MSEKRTTGALKIIGISLFSALFGAGLYALWSSSDMALMRKPHAMESDEAAGHGRNEEEAKQALAHKETWICPMHPQIVQDHPGKCPLCGMDLVKTTEDGMSDESADEAAHSSGQHSHSAPGRDGENSPKTSGLATVKIDAARQQLIGLRTEAAVSGPVGVSLRTSGRVSVDETAVRHFNVKVSGYVETIYVDFIGKHVKKGQPLFSYYSPELYAAQQEYLLALEAGRKLSEGGLLGDNGDVLIRAARKKLELWDVPEKEIERLENSAQPQKTLMLHSPISGVVVKKDVVQGMWLPAGAMPYEIVDLSKVWVLADIYESEVRHVRLGMKATLSLKAFPGRTFSGHIAFIDPLMDPGTRTVKVRLSFENPKGELRPEMFGEIVFEHPEREGLRIPSDAVVDSGTRQIVFVDLGDGKFQPREVKTQALDDRYVEVTEGLEEGDRVVTRANFLVDSESRLRASLSAMRAAASEAPEGGSRSGSAGPPVETGGGTGGANQGGSSHSHAH